MRLQYSLRFIPLSVLTIHQGVKMYNPHCLVGNNRAFYLMSEYRHSLYHQTFRNGLCVERKIRWKYLSQILKMNGLATAFQFNLSPLSTILPNRLQYILYRFTFRTINSQKIDDLTIFSLHKTFISMYIHNVWSTYLWLLLTIMLKTGRSELGQQIFWNFFMDMCIKCIQKMLFRL